MNMKIKLLSLVMGVLILLSVFSGCGAGSGQEGSKTTAETSAAVSDSGTNKVLPKNIDYDVVKELNEYSDIMKISVFADYGNFVTSPDDLTVKWIRDNLKIDLSGLEINPDGSFADKLKTKIATNDLPDVIWGLGDTMLFRSIATADNFLALDDLIKNYMPRVNKFIGDDIFNKYKSSDGKLYIMPGYTYPLNEMDKYAYPQNALCVEQDILAKTGLSVPTTPDELYNYLKASADQKTAKGAKVIPTAYYDFLPTRYNTTAYPVEGKVLMHMFDPGSTYHYCVKNDAEKMIDITYDSPGYTKFLKFFSRLYREGLLDKDNFTMSDDQYRERVKEGRYAFIYATMADAPQANNALSGVVNKPYSPINMIKDPSIKGSSNALVLPVLGFWQTLINKNFKDPERLAKFMEWQYTLDGVRIINYGAPDPTMTVNNWYYKDDGSVFIDMDLMTKWDAENYGWEWQKAGGWGIHAIGIMPPLKYTGVNEMGVNMSDDLFRDMEKTMSSEQTWNTAFEAMVSLVPIGPWFEKSGPAMNDLLNKWEVKIIINAKSDEEVDSMYAQMMAEARKLGYDDMKRELYNLYIQANGEGSK